MPGTAGANLEEREGPHVLKQLEITDSSLLEDCTRIRQRYYGYCRPQR